MVYIVCPESVEEVISSWKLPAKYSFSFSQIPAWKDAFQSSVVLLFHPLSDQSEHLIQQFRQNLEESLLSVICVMEHAVHKSADLPPYSCDELWSWPMEELIFKTKIDYAIKRIEKYNETFRLNQILLNQKQLFIKQKAKLENIIKSIPFGIIMVDAEGQVIVINKKAKEIIGVELDDDIQTSGYLRDKIDYYPFDLVRGMNDKDGVIIEEELILPTGRFLAKIVPVHDFDHSILGTLIIFQSMKEGIQFRDQARELVDTVLHEIRTPITSIVTSLEILEKELRASISKKHARILEISLNNCTRLIQLSTDFLDISKIESGYMDMVLDQLSLSTLIGEVVESFRIAAKDKGLRLDLIFNHTSDIVEVDPTRMRQVFNNLVSNAIKFSQPPNKITISCDDIDLDSKRMIQITVQNYGPILPPHDITKIFERFYRSEHSKRPDRIGSGLGLHITQIIINALGGDIWVESNAEEGTRFYFTLPLAY